MHTIHLSQSGNDANCGSKAAPLKSLKAARDRARALIKSRGPQEKSDITIFLEPGTYRLSETLILDPQDGGDGSFNVIWKGASDGRTIISSGCELKDWQLCSEEIPELPETARGKVWYTELPPKTVVNTLYHGDAMLPRARGQAIQPSPVALHAGEAPPRLYGPDGEIENTEPKKDNKWRFHDRFGFSNGSIAPAEDMAEAECLIIPAMQWTMNILPVESVDFDKQILHLQQNCTYPIGIPHCAPEGSIWLENSLSLIQPGTWVYHKSSSRLYYYPEGDRPESNLEAACLTELIRIEGLEDSSGGRRLVKGVEFDSITFTHTNRFAFHGLTGRGIQHDWEMHDAPSCMLRLRHAHECRVRNCSFQNGGSGGVRMDLACEQNTIEGCRIHHLGGCGIVLCGYGLSRKYLNRKNHILQNHLHHLGEQLWHSPGIFIWQSGDNTLSGNHLHDLPYTGIVCSGRSIFDREGIGECSRTINWFDVEAQCGRDYQHNHWHYSGLPSWWMREPLMHSRDNLIEFNRIHDVMQIMGDGNGIYVSGAGGGNVVRFNVIGPCHSPSMAEAIRCDDDQHHTIIHGNLIYQQGGHATGITLKGINRVTNNIIALPYTTPLRGMLSLETGPLNGCVIKRNIFYTTASDQNFVSEMRIHGEGRKARLRDTDSDENIFFCAGDLQSGKACLEELQSFGVDIHSLCCDPGFRDAESLDFSLREDAPALALGFQALPLDKMLSST
jgi:hypothetical protein